MLPLLLASPVASPVVGATPPLVTPAVPSPLSAAVDEGALDVSLAALVGAPEDEDDVVAGTAVADSPSPPPEHAASSDTMSHVSLPVGREREIITGARISATPPAINDRLYYSDTYDPDGVPVCSDKPSIRAGAVRCCQR